MVRLASWGLAAAPWSRYDAHREDILRGGTGESSDTDEDSQRGGLRKREVNLWPYFSASAFDSFEDSENSFWSVYSKAFAAVEDAEIAEVGEADFERVPFGDVSSLWDDVKRFYDTFADFTSARSFAAYDKWKISGDEPRHARRAADAENKRHRKAAKVAYQDMVRQLALWCRKRDPRVAARAEHMKNERSAKAAKALAEKAQQRQRNLQARQIWREQKTDETAFEAYEVRTGALLADLEDADGPTSSRRSKKGRRRSQNSSVSGEDTDRRDQTGDTQPDIDVGDVHKAKEEARNGDGTSEEQGQLGENLVNDDIVEIMMCNVCKRSFKSEKQLENHLQSKAHKKKAAGALSRMA